MEFVSHPSDGLRASHAPVREPQAPNPLNPKPQELDVVTALTLSDGLVLTYLSIIGVQQGRDGSVGLWKRGNQYWLDVVVDREPYREPLGTTD